MPFGVRLVGRIAIALEVRHYDVEFLVGVFCKFVRVDYKLVKQFARRAPSRARKFEHKFFPVLFCGFVRFVKVEVLDSALVPVKESSACAESAEPRTIEVRATARKYVFLLILFMIKNGLFIVLMFEYLDTFRAEMFRAIRIAV